jgi:hypothetical protein
VCALGHGTEGTTKKTIAGRIVRIDLDVAPFEITLFFTDEHAKVWLARASDEPAAGLGDAGQ